MSNNINTVAFSGIDTKLIDVQVQIVSGTVCFIIVGLPDKAVSESKERVYAALAASGLALPAKRIVVNLSPADLAKEGSHFDLPIALGVMGAMGVLPASELSNYIAMGELSLAGNILPVSGILPAAIGASASGKGLICAAKNGSEAAWANSEMNILAPNHLLDLANHFRGGQILARPVGKVITQQQKTVDISEIKGQESAKRALEIAAAGGHNMLMCGPPGCGKTMMASCLPSILPEMSAAEMLETSMVHSVAGKLAQGAISSSRPFISPHHSASMPSIIGGGRKALPGEVSLAHNGVLFLDELPEFSPNVLESLRQPLESGKAIITRAEARATYPARFQLIAAMNPCRCGYLGDPAKACSRAPKCAGIYQSRISGPLMDRIDIRVTMNAINPKDILHTQQTGNNQNKIETSIKIAARVRQAREKQQQRYIGTDKLTQARVTNAYATTAEIMEFMQLDNTGQKLLENAIEKFALSMRSVNRLLKLSRTIADLEDSDNIFPEHLAEAISYRNDIKHIT